MRKSKALCAIATFAALAVTLAGSFAYGDVIYQNDFSTRTSAAAIRSTEWKAVEYVSGELLANTNNAAPHSAPSGSSQKMQDGWIKSQETVNHGNAYVYADGDNNMAALGDTKSSNTAIDRKVCTVKQRLGATFTNGTVTVQFDFLPPKNFATWTDYSSLRRAAFSVGDENFYSPVVNHVKVYQNTVGSVGVAIPTGMPRVVYWNADFNSATTSTSTKEVARYKWHRAVMTINLDARTWGFTMYEMGDHPAFDAATPATPLHSESGLPLADSSVTSVSSICLSGYDVAWSDKSYSEAAAAGGGAPQHVAGFDNIRVSHNGVECYVNDFTTSRRRRLDGTTAWTYATDSLVTNSVRDEVYAFDTSNTLTTKLVPDRESDGTTVQTPGIDGWRRTSNSGGTGNAHVVKVGNDCYLRFDPGSNKTLFGFFVHPFGSTISSGKVRISVDARLPKSDWKADSKIWLALGNDKYYTVKPSSANSYRFANVGIRYGATENTPTYVPAGGGDSPNPSPDAPISPGHWYRLVLTADLDNNTSIYKLYEQGEVYPNSATPDGTLIYTSPANGKINTITSVSSFSLGVYYSPVYFDNVKVWHIPTGSETETLLYENLFSTRTVYPQDRRVAQIVGSLLKDPEGQDGWAHIFTGTTSAYVTDDENPSLVFARSNSGSLSDVVVHDLGQTLRNGMVTAQADIRPSRGWLTGSEAGSVYVRLGGDAHLMGNVRDDNANYLKNIATGFGFKRIGTGKSGNLYTNSTIVAYRGDCAGGGAMEEAASGHAVDPSHWYRFVARTEVRKNQYDLAVYDMAEPVATFTALPFRRTIRDLGGISCISVSTCNNPNSVYDSTLSARVDNLRIEQVKPGVMLLIR